MSSLSEFSLMPVTIDGVSYRAQPEYTSEDVALEFRRSLAVFVDLINIQNNVSATISSGTYHTQMQAALFGGTVIVGGVPVPVNGLLNLAANGRLDPTTGKTHYITVEMANALDQVLRSLRAANVPVDGSAITVTDAFSWRNLAVTSNVVPSIIQLGLDTSGVDNRTLQALVELVYVNTGNQVLSDKLASLETALTATSDSLEILNNLQQLHNNLTAEPRISFTSAFPTLMGGNFNIAANFMIGTGDFLGFTAATEQHYRAIDPILLTPIDDDTLAQFQDTINRLRLQISTLSDPTITPTLPDGKEDPQTLLGRLRVVYNDILRAISTSPCTLVAPAHFSVDAGGLPIIIPEVITTLTSDERLKIALSRWTLDSYSAVPSGGALGNAGDIQRNLTSAITAGQNLNDTQKEEIRRYLFVFEEYYKSAAAILNKITQIIEKMAQGISR